METDRSNQKRAPLSGQVSMPAVGYAIPRRTGTHYGIAYQRVKAAPLNRVNQDGVMVLQRTIGNQAIGQLIQSKRSEHETMQWQQQPEEGEVQARPNESTQRHNREPLQLHRADTQRVIPKLMIWR